MKEKNASVTIFKDKLFVFNNTISVYQAFENAQSETIKGLTNKPVIKYVKYFFFSAFNIFTIAHQDLQMWSTIYFYMSIEVSSI